MMSPRHRTQSWPIPAAIAAAAITLTAATGCSAGQQSQTASQVAAVNGTNIERGSIALRNVYLAADPRQTGDTRSDYGPVSLVFTAVNTSELTVDRLMSIESESASVTLTATPEELELQPGTALDAGAPIEQLGAPTAPDHPVTATVQLVDGTVEPGLPLEFTFTFATSGAITAGVPYDVIAPGEPVPAYRDALTA